LKNYNGFFLPQTAGDESMKYTPPRSRDKGRGLSLYIRRLVFLSLAALLFFSCATSPKFPDPFEDETAFLPLEPGASVYMLIDVPGCRPVLDRIAMAGMDKKQSDELLNRTRSAVAAFYPEGSEQRFQATAWGKYPGFRGSLALAAGKDWKKNRSKIGGAYYHSARDGLSVALTGSRAFVSGAGPGNHRDPFTEAPGTEIPEGFAEFRRGAVLAFWLDDPAPPVNRFFDALEIPLQLPAERLLVSVFPAGPGEDDKAAADTYEALIQIQAPSASQARALLTLFNMARVFAPAIGEAGGASALASILFANPPVQDGRNLNLRTATMDAERIALLFSLFPVY
jgi:hypothetical protein